MGLNQGCTYTERLGPKAAGRSLVQHLAGAYPHSSEGEWRERIAAGLVRLDGHAADADARVRGGQVLTWARPPWEEPEAPLGWALLYEDGDLVAVAKPSGLPTLPGAGFLEHTLLHLVRRRFPEASPMHRLGRGTSGLVLFARNQESQKAISEAWRTHQVTKLYRALVEGHPAQDAFTLETPIGPVPHPELGTLHAASAAGRASRSDVVVLERRAETSLVEVSIATGRPHQIRIHLAAAGHPLVGDPLYAAGGSVKAEALPGDLGYWLHAWRLTVPHPRTGAAIAFECPPPPLLRGRAGA